MEGAFCVCVCAVIIGLFICALAFDMFLLWHCREAETMRAGATAFSGIGAAKLILCDGKKRSK
jgi:hypothetical protein